MMNIIVYLCKLQIGTMVLVHIKWVHISDLDCNIENRGVLASVPVNSI